MKNLNTYEEFLNEGLKLPSPSQSYASQIWEAHENDILELVSRINGQSFDFGSSEIVCEGLARILDELSSDKVPSAYYNKMNK
jgi:hypothetical protein